MPRITAMFVPEGYPTKWGNDPFIGFKIGHITPCAVPYAEALDILKHDFAFPFNEGNNLLKKAIIKCGVKPLVGSKQLNGRIPRQYSGPYSCDW